VASAGAGAVLLVSVLACYLPARAAGRTDPMVVLRQLISDAIGYRVTRNVAR
jgi:hypothetical protein